MHSTYHSVSMIESRLFLPDSRMKKSTSCQSKTVVFSPWSQVHIQKWKRGESDRWFGRYTLKGPYRPIVKLSLILYSDFVSSRFLDCLSKFWTWHCVKLIAVSDQSVVLFLILGFHKILISPIEIIIIKQKFVWAAFVHKPQRDGSQASFGE